MNRSFRAQETQMTMKQRQEAVAGLRNSMIKENEEDLALFMDMRKHEKQRANERGNLMLYLSDEFEDYLGSKPASMPEPMRKTGADNFLNSESDKSDYDWLRTPPGTPLFPSLEVDTQKTYMSQFATSIGRSTSLNSRVAYPHLEIPKRNSLVPKQPSSCPGLSNIGTRRPSSSGGPGPGSRPGTPTGRATSRPATPTGRATSRPATPTGQATSRPATPTGGAASRPATPTARPTLNAKSRTSRPSTPNSRTSLSSNNLTMPASSSSAGPTRSKTPLARPVARSSTPSGRASISTSNSTSRASTPTLGPSASPSTYNSTGTLSRSSSLLSRSVNSGPTGRASIPASSPKSKASGTLSWSSSFLSRSVNSGISSTRQPRTTPNKNPVSSSVRSVTSAPKSSASAPSRAPSPTLKPRPWNPSDMPGFSMDAPPNLRTSAPERPLSASRGRPLSTSRSSSIEPGTAGRPKRQSCSPSRGRLSNGSVHPSGSSVPAPRRTPPSNDNVNPILMGTRMVERVVSMRKLAPPQDDRHSPSLSGKSASSPDSTRFGGTLSRKSLDMAIRHMDIRSISGNLWPLMSNIPASSMYSVRSGPGGSMRGRTRTVSVSDSPLATSSNASSEMSVNNNGLHALDFSELEDDNHSDRSLRTPSGIRRR